MENSKKRQRFNVKTLERYEFVNYIIEHLELTLGLKIESHRIDKHLKFCKGIIKEKGEFVPIAIVGYGGSGKDLRDLPTPLQTELLPLVFKYWHRISDGNSKIPLLVLGHSFDEVFLRKMRLLNIAVPDLRLIQFINAYRFNSIERRFKSMKDHYENHLIEHPKIRNEVNDFHPAVVEHLKSGIELGGRSYDVLDCEVPAGEGTVKAEVIDILALEKKRKWLTVIELKYEKLSNARLQSSIFQGLDYCNWVEEHKRGLSMLFPQYNIDVRRRARFILINGPEKFPAFHLDFAELYIKKDKYQEIEFYYSNSKLPLKFTQFTKTEK